MKNDFKNRIFVSITGRYPKHWREKLDEVNKYKLEKVCLFLECFDRKERKDLPGLLLKSCIKNIPLIHIRTDITNQEIEFYKTIVIKFIALYNIVVFDFVMVNTGLL